MIAHSDAGRPVCPFNEQRREHRQQCAVVDRQQCMQHALRSRQRAGPTLFDEVAQRHRELDNQQRDEQPTSPPCRLSHAIIMNTGA